MEKLFNARWWDYHNRKFNINGRVCLEMLIPFGIGGTVIAHFLNPMFIDFFSKIDPKILTIAIVLMVFTNIVDYIISFVVISRFKKAVYSEADNTEEISNMVKEVTKEKLEEEKQNVIRTRRRIRLKRLIIKNKIRYNSKQTLRKLDLSSKDIAKSIYDKYNEWNIKYLERKVSFDNKIVKLRENFRISQEQFAENVKNRFNNNSYLRRRLIESFPNLTIKMPKMKGRKKN